MTKNTEEAIKKLREMGDDEAAEALEQELDDLKKQAIRGGITAIFARNLSHGLRKNRTFIK